ncbi:MAG: FKBP-type peptidyl-prolyl cis-trans isomerase [Bacteroidales bacterium]|jgi:FKBP-type peptidyl-prolyl cis-trans isomerase|nr:FKBP-type peptidyl-prolyl cis-trans isomerase [Bacteroidales bacterium]MDY0197371.1 FKBP-type peptidyl-prolyl cis-trans isomerase [Tenuifilaceae bacterium]
MKHLKILALLAVVVLVSSCGNNSKLYPSFSVTKSNIHYKLITIGETDQKAQPTDFVNVLVTYRTPNDSIFFQGARTFQLTEPQFIGSIDECFTMLAAGDSATFYLSADDFFTKTIETTTPRFFKVGDLLRVDIKMLGILTEKAYQREKETFLHWIEDFGEYEKVLLKQYIDEQTNDFEQTASGIYYIPIKQGTGNKIQVGDTITVHYEGRFFNGKYFDSTRKRDEAFQFVYGQKWQVIQGLEEAIGMMYPQERSIFIIPSHMAFGQGGSSTGIVPAFTPVIFEVEVIEVKPKNK